VLGGEGCVADNNLIHDISYGGTYCCGIFPAPGSARNTITRNTIFRTGRSAMRAEGLSTLPTQLATKLRHAGEEEV
jgi:hypothetical protein